MSIRICKQEEDGVIFYKVDVSNRWMFNPCSVILEKDWWEWIAERIKELEKSGDVTSVSIN